MPATAAVPEVSIPLVVNGDELSPRLKKRIKTLQEMQKSIQAELDFEIVMRRYNDAKKNPDKLISEEEFWKSVEGMG